MKTKKLLKKYTTNAIDDNCYYNAEDMIDFAKYVLKEKLTLPDVSQQRDLLIAYELNIFKGKEQCTQEMAEKMVDNYLKAINCG